MTAVQAAGYTKAAVRGMVCRNHQLPQGNVVLHFFSTLLIFQVLHLILLAKQEVLLHLWKRKLQTGLFSSALHSFKALTVAENQPYTEFKNVQAVTKTLNLVE